MEFRNWVQGLLGIGDGVLEPDSRSLLSGVEPRRAAGVGWLSVHRASTLPASAAHTGAASDDVLALPTAAVPALPTAPSPARARSVVNSRFVTPATHNSGAQRRPPPTAPARAATHAPAQQPAVPPRAPPVAYARARPAMPPPARAPQQQLVRQQQQPKSGGARFLVQAYRGAPRPQTAKAPMPRNVRAVVVRATPGAAGLLQRAMSGFQRGGGGRSGMRLRA